MNNKFFYAALLSTLFISGCASRNDAAPVVTYSSANKETRAVSTQFQEETITHTAPPSTTMTAAETAPASTPTATPTTDNKQAAPFAEGLPEAQEQVAQKAEVETHLEAANESAPQITETVVTEEATEQSAIEPAAEEVAATEPAPPVSKKAGRWIWPTQGKVIQDFKGDKHTNKGIEIGGAAGTAIHSADAGTVIYQGSGIKGYGKMVVIKHGDGYVTAYAHNEEVLVKEGDTVKQGQKIATMGKSGADQVKLHFEIRRNGRPIDPMQELP